jgi:hypothetical protein
MIDFWVNKHKKEISDFDHKIHNIYEKIAELKVKDEEMRILYRNRGLEMIEYMEMNRLKQEEAAFADKETKCCVKIQVEYMRVF